MNILEATPYKCGDKVRYISREPYGHKVREGDIGVVVDVQPGIFDNSPYAVVLFDDKKYTMHTTRLNPISYPEDGPSWYFHYNNKIGEFSENG
jgi:hypothetical protein